jgi:hypothetical protein
MKVTLKNIVDAQESFTTLLKKNIPFRATYRLSKLIMELNKEMEAYEKVKGELFKKYGEEIEIEGQKMLEIKKDKMNIFMADNNDLLAEEITLAYEPMFIEDLVSIKEGKEEEDVISVKDMIALKMFFKSKEEIVVEDKSKEEIK